jgi:hypothetical protein
MLRDTKLIAVSINGAVRLRGLCAIRPSVAEAGRCCYAFAYVAHAASGKASFDSLGKRHLGQDNRRGRPAKAKRD